MDESGRILGVGVGGRSPTESPHPLWSEQEPARGGPGPWVRSARPSIARASTGATSRHGLTGRMHGLVLLDGSGAVLRPGRNLWNDQRTGAECDHIREIVGRVRP